MCYLAASSLYWPWVCVSTAPWGSSRRRRFSVSCKSSVVTLDRPSAWARTDGDILARIRFRWTFRKHPRSLNSSSRSLSFWIGSGMDSRPGGGLYFRLSNLTKLYPLEPSQRDGPRTLHFPVSLSSRVGCTEPFEVHPLHIWRLHAEAFFADWVQMTSWVLTGLDPSIIKQQAVLLEHQTVSIMEHDSTLVTCQ